MKNWFYKLSKAKQIAVTVLLAHFGCLLFLSADYLLSWAPPKRRKVVVNMVTIAPPKVQPLTPTKSAPAPKKMAPKPPVAKKPIAKPTTQPVAKPEAIAKGPPPLTPETVSLLNELEANMETILETIAAPAPTPPQKTAMHIPILTEIIRETISVGSADEIIAAFLQEVLTLPEFGDVRVAIAIDRLGHLKSLDVLTAKSEKNATFLKNRLPELQYPCLNEGASLTVLFSNAL
jgi:hypothetical protein